MAPEVYSCQEYSGTQADVWSLGIVLFIMLTGVPPMEIPSVQDDRFRLMKSSGAKALLRAWRMNTWFSSDAMDLLNRILVVEPSRRPTVEEILSHPWFGGRKPVSARMTEPEPLTSFEDDNMIKAIADVSLEASNPVMKKQKTLRNLQREQYHHMKAQEQSYAQYAHHSVNKENIASKGMGAVPAPFLADNLLNKTVLGHIRNRVESAKLWEAYQQKRDLLKEAWKSSCPWNPVA